MRSSTRRSRKMGPAGLVEKRPLYVQLMKQGLSNSAACRTLGIHQNTGQRWLHGRNGVEGLVQQGLDPRPRVAVPATDGSARYLSEDERIFIADRLLAGSSLRSIGRDLGRSASTISRELARNRPFCDPASPWQRASNENANGLLRQYFRKGADLSTVEPAEVLFASDEINRRPRAVLDWSSATARFALYQAAAVVGIEPGVSELGAAGREHNHGHTHEMLP